MRQRTPHNLSEHLHHRKSGDSNYSKSLHRGRNSGEDINPIPTAANAWEISSDDDETTLHLEKKQAYHPLHPEPPQPQGKPFARLAASSGIPSPPGSFPSSWRPSATVDKTKALLQVPIAPSSLSGIRSYSSLRTPLIVPDSGYQAYLLGRSAKRRRSLIDNICCAKFCAMFSFVAVLFLVFVGILVDLQPLLIKGVLPQHIQYTEGMRKPLIFYSLAKSERVPAATHAYQAALVYFLTGVGSATYAYNLVWWLKSRWRRYHDIPDADPWRGDTDSTIPTFHTAANGNDGGSSSSMNSARRAYQYRRRLWAEVKKIIVWSIQRMGIFLDSVWPGQLQRRHRPRRRGAAAAAKDV